MAHEIDRSTGRAAVFVTGEPAWHRLGTVISHAVDSAEAIQLAGLDWEVQPWPLLAYEPGPATDERRTQKVAGAVANVRTDTGAVLGVVSAGYRVFQNREAFDFMDELVGEQLAMYETAGALKGGRRVWMLARVPKEYRVGQDDLVRPYVLLTNSHDGSMALRMIPTTVRVVCQNTLSLALRRAGSEGVVITHHESLQARVREAREKLGLLTKRFDRFGAEIQALVRQPLSSTELAGYFDGLIPVESEKARQKVRDAWLTNWYGERNNLPGIRGSAWAAYNAVSEWADHQRRVRGSTELEKADNRLTSIWFGSSHRLKQQAFDRALELATAA
jgi:phage/plasmid-like protein (TIGR03299 family)